MKTCSTKFLHILRIAHVPAFSRILLLDSGSCNTNSALIKLNPSQRETSSTFFGMEAICASSAKRERGSRRVIRRSSWLSPFQLSANGQQNLEESGKLNSWGFTALVIDYSCLTFSFPDSSFQPLWLHATWFLKSHLKISRVFYILKHRKHYGCK